jgi:hypothetical protein
VCLVVCVIAEGQGGGEGAVGEVHGGGVRRGAAQGRAPGHQGAAEDNPLPPHPGTSPYT